MQCDGTVRNVDIYYDTPAYNLLQQAVFVRVRNNQHLEFKFNEHAEKTHGQSTERTFSLLPDADMAAKMHALFTRFLPHWYTAPTVEAAFTHNGLIELARIENNRESFSQDGIYVSIDHVTGLGEFLEVETRCEEGTDTSHAQSRLHTFISDLNVEHIRVGYVELWLRMHNPHAYQLGKYHL